MRWRRMRQAADTQPAPPALTASATIEGTETDVTMSEETRQAVEAARLAGQQLAQVRARGPEIVRPGEELHEYNRHNGYYLLIRRALGSG